MVARLLGRIGDCYVKSSDCGEDDVLLLLLERPDRVEVVLRDFGDSEVRAQGRRFN